MDRVAERREQLARSEQLYCIDRYQTVRSDKQPNKQPNRYLVDITRKDK
jgi:hypothetical protein